MSIATTTIFHKVGYNPTGPTGEITRTTRVWGDTTEQTVIEYDDSLGSVPVGPLDMELDRRTVVESIEYSNKVEILRKATEALTTLRQIRDANNLNDSNQVAAIKELARIMVGVVKVLADELSTPE